MKYKMGFRLDWLQMIIILASVFFSGMLMSSEMQDKFIYVGLCVFGAGIIVMKNRVKLPVKKN